MPIDIVFSNQNITKVMILIFLNFQLKQVLVCNQSRTPFNFNKLVLIINYNFQLILIITGTEQGYFQKLESLGKRYKKKFKKNLVIILCNLAIIQYRFHFSQVKQKLITSIKILGRQFQDLKNDLILFHKDYF